MENEIVGFKIIIKNIKAKFKLGQNRGIDDMKSVSMNLSKLNTENSISISKYINDILNSE
jgi:predicted FMN-binding regulatory protein PaiB